MSWPLEKASVSHRLTYTSLSVRSGGPRLTLAGWWATRISATVRFYTATQLCSTRYRACVCKMRECEMSVSAFQHLTCGLLQLTLNYLLLWFAVSWHSCWTMSVLWNFTGSNIHFSRGMNARKNDSLKQNSWITGSVWLCWAFDLLLLFISFCTGNNKKVPIVLN